MGLVDKVKSQATQLGDLVNQASQVGEAKVSELRYRRRVVSLVNELGALLYAQRVGRATPGADSRMDQIMEELQQHEAEYGPISAP